MNLSYEWTRDEQQHRGRAWPNQHRMALGETLSINGLCMHLWAFEVVRDETGCQVAVDPQFQDEVDWAQNYCEGALQTVELEGLVGEWIIVAVPHGD